MCIASLPGKVHQWDRNVCIMCLDPKEPLPDCFHIDFCSRQRRSSLTVMLGRHRSMSETRGGQAPAPDDEAPPPPADSSSHPSSAISFESGYAMSRALLSRIPRCSHPHCQRLADNQAHDKKCCNGCDGTAASHHRVCNANWSKFEDTARWDDALTKGILDLIVVFNGAKMSSVSQGCAL